MICKALSEVMAEPCIYGGLLATRGEIFADLAWLEKRTRWPFVDRLAFMYRTATPDEVAREAAYGFTLKNMRAAEAEAQKTGEPVMEVFGRLRRVKP